MSRVIKAVYWTLRYHLGTVCFGSLVLLIASSVKAVCQYILSRAPAPAGLQEVHWLLSKCILMLVSFVERLIRYFTSQVFTQVAISSQSFCSSAKSISKVTSISLLKFDFICEFMLLAGKLAVGALTTLICSKIIEHGILVEEAFNSTSIKTITLTIVFGLSWLVASLFTYLWSSACESVITLQALERAQANTPYDSKLGNTVGSSIDSISESRDLS